MDVYNTAQASILRCHPEDNLPSYDQMKKILAEITGVGSVVHPMCRNSCVAFTGPFMDLDHCPKCREPKCCPISRKYQQEFHKMPIGPILQALWHDPQSAHQFEYHQSKPARSSTTYTVIPERYQLMKISFMEVTILKMYRMVTLPTMILFSCFPLMVLSSMPIKHLIVGYIFG